MFMFSQPDDNEETIKRTIDYSLSLPNQLVQYSVFTPYPGTPIYKAYEDKIIEKKYEKFNQYNLVLPTQKFRKFRYYKVKKLWIPKILLKF